MILNDDIDVFPNNRTDEEDQIVMAKKVFKQHPIKIIIASLCILLFIALKVWDAYVPLSITDRNKNEISRIKVADLDNFTFAVFGDNKGNYSFFEPLLHDIAQDKEIAFAIDAGDLVRDGKRRQYRHFLNQVQENIMIPFLTAIGNHDLNNGSIDNYHEIFGPTYYAFQIGQNYFFVLDATSELGFDKTERQWLEDKLNKAQGAKARFAFMHVPPFDPRGTYPPERNWKDFMDLLRRYNVTHLFASHIHGYFSGVQEEVPYTITGGAGARLQGNDPQHFFHHYIKVHVKNGKVELTVRRIDREGIMTQFFDLMEDYVLEWALLLGAGISLLMLELSMRSRQSSDS
jgi:hypothetical protein